MTSTGTVVDSSVLLDVFTEDRRWLPWSEERLTEAAQQGALILNAVVLAEIAPRFSRIESLRDALPSMAVLEEIPTEASFWQDTPMPPTGELAAHPRPCFPTSSSARTPPSPAVRC